jgi:hypothetical protein
MAAARRRKDERFGRRDNRRFDDSEMAPQAVGIARNGLGVNGDPLAPDRSKGLSNRRISYEAFGAIPVP